MEVKVNITMEQSRLMIENAIRNFPESVPRNIKSVLEFIIKSTTDNDRRQRLRAQADDLSLDELDALLNNEAILLHQ